MHVAHCSNHYAVSVGDGSCLIHLKQRILSHKRQIELLLVQGIGFPLLSYLDVGWRRVPERTNADTKRINKQMRRVKRQIILYSAKQNKTNSFNWSLVYWSILFASSHIITVPNKSMPRFIHCSQWCTKNRWQYTTGADSWVLGSRESLNLSTNFLHFLQQRSSLPRWQYSATSSRINSIHTYKNVHKANHMHIQKDFDTFRPYIRPSSGSVVVVLVRHSCP